MITPWAASSAGERSPHTREVVGSIPTPPTRCVAPSSSGLGRSPLKAETAGSNPAGATNFTMPKNAPCARPARLRARVRIPPGLLLYTSLAQVVCIMVFVRRIQIHIDEALDDSAEVEAARRGLSKAALIRASLARALAIEARPDADPWQALTGWLDDGQIKDLDAVIYDQDR